MDSDASTLIIQYGMLSEKTALMTNENQVAPSNFNFHSIEEAIEAIREGKMIIVVDDEDRENEGDLICAAECVTPEMINFMTTHGRGLVCAPLSEERVDELGLTMMVPHNTALHETAFTVSIDLIGQGCSTGISAYDRATCLRALVDPEAKPTDFARPGHIFPLRAMNGGVLRRTGHTEASIDLARLAGFSPAGVLIEILNEDGSMARLPQLIEMSKKFDLKLIAIKDLVAYRMRTERLIKRETVVPMETDLGKFEVIAYTQVTNNDVHIAIKMGEWTEDESILVRAHSSNETGDLMANLFGNTGSQIQESLKMIAEEGRGVLVMMRHGEKDAGILQKLEEIKMRQEGKQPLKNETLGQVAQRDYGIGAQILRDLSVKKIRLLTNHPRRRVGMLGFGLEVVENVELKTQKTPIELRSMGPLTDGE